MLEQPTPGTAPRQKRGTPIADVSRQPLIMGTTTYTDPEGQIGWKPEEIIASAAVRMAAALEQQTELLLQHQPATARAHSPISARVGMSTRDLPHFRSIVASSKTRGMRIVDDSQAGHVDIEVQHVSDLFYLGKEWEAKRNG